ncbi:MAG: carboxypeptidase M32 [Candidatus Thorarchaeota archaeon]|nr:carboxypeptidase M32 [Candidatus Thorarchaeota archaeon]
MEAYDDLMNRMKEYLLLYSAAGVVQWDYETYMPPKGLMLRSEQLAVIHQILHRMGTDPEIGKLLGKAEKNSKKLNEVQNRNVFMVRREYDKETKIPEDLVARIAKQTPISLETWKKAKATSDWKLFEPELQKTLDLGRERAEIEMKVKGIPILYDSMLDEFERGITSKQITKVFKELRDRLVPLTKKCADASKDLDTSFLSKKVPIDVQRKIATDLSTLVGYDTVTDKAGGRIDEVEHPFTTGYYDDVRITVKYHEDNVSSAVYAILHEAGHALYEQNLNPEWKYMPIGSNASFGVHESQSRFLENMVCRSPEFLKFYLPKLKEFTGGSFPGVDDATFIKAMNLVKPSLIRIEADEVTYALHIIVRFEIEQDLFSDKVTVSELPQVWNEKYREYLGIDVPDDGNGVLQDTHWASGYFGYFPSYALGNIYDGMLLDKMQQDLPDWLNGVAKGEILPIVNWMKEKVHVQSAMYDPAELMERVTGRKLTAEPFLEYVENKYSSIFGF